MDLLGIIGLVIGLIVLFLIVSVAVIQFDLTSYTATGIELMSPTGTPVGSALVVYNPGVTGVAKKAAVEIAGELQSNGYKVTLAGVRNTAVTNTSDYDVIIAGGPMYFGKVSNSIDTYLKTLIVPENAKLGVFATTGTDQGAKEDLTTLENQVASLQNGKNFTIKLVRDSNEEYAVQDYKGLVSALS